LTGQSDYGIPYCYRKLENDIFWLNKSWWKNWNFKILATWCANPVEKPTLPPALPFWSALLVFFLVHLVRIHPSNQFLIALIGQNSDPSLSYLKAVVLSIYSSLLILFLIQKVMANFLQVLSSQHKHTLPTTTAHFQVCRMKNM